MTIIRLFSWARHKLALPTLFTFVWVNNVQIGDKIYIAYRDDKTHQEKIVTDDKVKTLDPAKGEFLQLLLADKKKLVEFMK